MAGSLVNLDYRKILLELEEHVAFDQLQSRIALGHDRGHLKQRLEVALDLVALEVVHEESIEQLVAFDRIQHCFEDVPCMAWSDMTTFLRS
jgi:hypothetical protein